MESPRQLVTALRPHRLVLSVVEGMQCEVLYFLVVLRRDNIENIKKVLLATDVIMRTLTYFGCSGF